jgi:hypothetical protein
MLGRANIAITLDTYVHVLPTMQDNATRALEDALRRCVAAYKSREAQHRDKRASREAVAPQVNAWREVVGAPPTEHRPPTAPRSQRSDWDRSYRLQGPPTRRRG